MADTFHAKVEPTDRRVRWKVRDNSRSSPTRRGIHRLNRVDDEVRPVAVTMVPNRIILLESKITRLTVINPPTGEYFSTLTTIPTFIARSTNVSSLVATSRDIRQPWWGWKKNPGSYFTSGSRCNSDRCCEFPVSLIGEETRPGSRAGKRPVYTSVRSKGQRESRLIFPSGERLRRPGKNLTGNAHVAPARLSMDRQR